MATGKERSRPARRPDTRAAPAVGPDELSAVVAFGHRVSDIGERLNVGGEGLLAALELMAAATPAGSDAPEHSLTVSEEKVLREAGSLQHSMPALPERASFRTQLLFEQLLHEALSVKAAAERLHVSESRVRQRLTARTLLGVERGGTWQLPAFQFTDDADMPGLSEVLPSFPEDVHPAAVLLFLDAPSSDLDVDGQTLTPREWLVTGGSARRVVELVRQAYALS